MAENQSITGSEVSEPQALPAATFCETCGEMFENGKSTCWRCEVAKRKAEQQEAIKKKVDRRKDFPQRP